MVTEYGLNTLLNSTGDITTSVDITMVVETTGRKNARWLL
jgi:hypothetical protein